MVDQRVVVAAAATLTWQASDQNGELADPSTVTVTLTRSDGTAIVTGAATTGTGTSARSYTLSQALNTQTDLLTAVWKAGAQTLATTKIGVVGRVYLSAAQIRAKDAALVNAATYPDSDLWAARAQTESIFEDICGVAFVPRFEVERHIGRGTNRLLLNWGRLRYVRWARVYNADNVTYTALTAAEIASIASSESGVCHRLDGMVWFADRMIELGYEHGYDKLPVDLESQAVKAIRQELNSTKSGIPDRAMSYQPIEGGSVQLVTAGIGRWHVGIPSVDEALMRYSHRAPHVGSQW